MAAVAPLGDAAPATHEAWAVQSDSTRTFRGCVMHPATRRRATAKTTRRWRGWMQTRRAPRCHNGASSRSRPVARRLSGRVRMAESPPAPRARPRHDIPHRRWSFRAVDQVSFEVPRGSTVALVRESGAEKSVTALSILRLVASPRARSSRARWSSTDATSCASRSEKCARCAAARVDDLPGADDEPEPPSTRSAGKSSKRSSSTKRRRGGKRGRARWTLADGRLPSRRPTSTPSRTSCRADSASA